MSDNIILHDVELDGRTGIDVRVRAGKIFEIGRGLTGPESRLDAHGGALIPGLIDHHLHLFSMAAAAGSVRLGSEGASNPADLTRSLRLADVRGPAGVCLRIIDYHDRIAGPLTREVLDGIVLDRAVRVQYATGSLWVLNSAALELVLRGEPPPGCLECDASGRPTGRVWRGDEWLRSRLPPVAPNLGDVGAALARTGVTAVCDASATTDKSAATLFAAAKRNGALPQRLMLMSASEIEQPEDLAFEIGPVKVLLDDDTIDLDDLVARIKAARSWSRNVAFHCVSAIQLAAAIAALATAGQAPGDRIEHCGVASGDMARMLARLGLTVVTQPRFITERGDRYLQDSAPGDLDALYPCASLLRAGVRVAGSTDAPYTDGDVWAAMAAATTRITSAGQTINAGERIDSSRALGLFLGPLNEPGGRARKVERGALADLCILDRPLRDVLAAPRADHVAATLIGGRVCWVREPADVRA